MGCDIHIYVEQKIDNSWTIVPENKGPISLYYREGENSWDIGRNYILFSLLAGVRNYYDLPLIKDPAGLPKDISKKVHNIFKEGESDYHTPSWFSLEELLVIKG